MHLTSATSAAVLIVTAAWVTTAARGADAVPPLAPEAICERMLKTEIPDVRIEAATSVAPSPEWSSPSADSIGSGTVRVPFCRLEGVIEKEIRFELWLPPTQTWNGRYLGSGNGGDAGFINYPILARGVTRGFASASTDTGHQLSDPHWALGHPDRLENYGFRAHHLLAVDAKKLIAVYYGQAAQRSYFLGCSGGGMQGMNEAQRYPADYDGVVAGASGFSMAPLSARFLMSALLARSDPDGVLSPDDWKLVTKAAVDQCDGIDGVKDGVIQDPRKCAFDPAKVPGLSAAKARQAAKILGPLLASDGHQLYPGLPPGAAFVAQDRQVGIATRFFGEWVYQDPHWDPMTFDLTRDYAAAEDQIAGLRFSNPDLEPFERHGSKLITYVGWSDPIVPAMANIKYHDSVTSYLGEERTNSFFRLFMVPGMGHCAGGDGATEFGQAFRPDPPIEDAAHDVLTAVMEWVEHQRAPDKIIASSVKDSVVSMTRPLCAYPKFAHYSGHGDINNSNSFTCVR